jgi:hypothetical protein
MDCTKVIVNFITNEKTWAIVAAVSGAIAAIAAMLTIYQASSSSREERESRRPYFTLAAPGIKPLPQSPPYRIQITMENIGVHSANEIIGKIIIIDKSLSKPPETIFNLSIANDVPPKTPTPWYKDDLALPANVPPQYIVLGIKYIDPMLKKYFTQLFYMKWAGVSNGQTYPDFVHVTIEEKAAIFEHYSNILKEFQEKEKH